MCLQSTESGAGWKTNCTKRAPSSWEQDTHALDGSLTFTQEQMNEKSPESFIAHQCISSFCEHLTGRRAENVQIRSYCVPPACCDLFVQDSKFLPTPRSHDLWHTHCEKPGIFFWRSLKSFQTRESLEGFSTMAAIFRASDLSSRNPSALLLYLIPLNHLSCRQGEQLRGETAQHEPGSSVKDSCVYTDRRKLAGWTGRTAPVSPHFISSSDARKSVSYKDLMFALWPQRLISPYLFVSHEFGVHVDDGLVKVILHP